MELRVQRAPAVDRALPGTLFLDGALFARTLENATCPIPAGRYPVSLTRSARALEGQLWTPDPDDRLPLVSNVPGRSGIRLHAANEWNELEGCIAVGQTLTGTWLGRSRLALTALLARLEAATDAIVLDVIDPPAAGTGTVNA